MFFVIPGTPGVKERPRLGKYGFYTPKKTEDFEKKVKTCYRLQSNVYFDTDFLIVKITAYFEIPKTYKGAKLKAVLNGKYFPPRKDVDNICKVVCDALNKVAYKDDSQIIDCHIKKVYDIKVNSSARIEVELTNI